MKPFPHPNADMIGCTRAEARLIAAPQRLPRRGREISVIQYGQLYWLSHNEYPRLQGEKRPSAFILKPRYV